MDPADKPGILAPRGAAVVLVESTVTRTTRVPSLGPGRLIICGPWLHTQRTSICDLHIAMASELHRHDPMFKEQRRPRCSALAKQSAMYNMYPFSKSDLRQSS